MTEAVVTVASRESKKHKLGPAYAAFINSPVGSSELYADVTLSSFTGRKEPDKMSIPVDFHERIALIRYYYELDPIARTVVDKIIDIGISPLILDRNECGDDEYKVYSYNLDVFNSYLKQAALEYLLSGLVVPRVQWDTVTPAEIGTEKTRRFELPVASWVLDPQYITLLQVPLTERVLVVLTAPEELRSFITQKGKFSNGAEDVEALIILKEQYPEFFQKGKKVTAVQLRDAFLIRRRAKSYDPYPTPFLLAALESLMFKRNLKKMDYSIASRVIGAIQLIKLGNDLFPLTEDDEDQLDELETTMLWRNTPKNIDRVFQLFSNHTLNIEWIYPDTQAMLNQDKYEPVNQDIFFALGFPLILLSGETARSATSQAEFAMFSPAETVKRFREEILTWVKELVDEIQERNNLEHKVTPKFEELRIYDLAKLAEMVKTLFQSNALSLTSLAKALGFDFEDEVVMKARERDILKKYDLPESQPVPFSPAPKVLGQTQPTEEKPPKEEVPKGGD
jgi:hypothetical protein